MAKVTSKLQVTVPKRLAERFEIAPGDEIEWEAAGDAIRVVPVRGRRRRDRASRARLFDPARVRDAATFERPHQYAEGVTLVVVNGQPVFENGAMTAARPGRVLYGPACQPPGARR